MILGSFHLRSVFINLTFSRYFYFLFFSPQAIDSTSSSAMIMDPSSRGMSKQIMLDWLRINHPQIPIKSGSTKTEVAKIVREVQPQCKSSFVLTHALLGSWHHVSPTDQTDFPDPGGDAPAVDAVGTLSPGRLISSSSRILPVSRGVHIPMHRKLTHDEFLQAGGQVQCPPPSVDHSSSSSSALGVNDQNRRPKEAICHQRAGSWTSF